MAMKRRRHLPAISSSRLVSFRPNPSIACLLALSLWAGFLPADVHAQVPTYLIAKKAVWKYSADGSQPPADWKETGFNDDRWKSGPAGFGYGDADDETVLSDMRNRYTAVYLRKGFNLAQIGDWDSLYLYVNYDDAFIAYLNGKEVASAAVHRDADTLRVDQHEAAGYELFVIRNAKALLRRGANVLAIEGHNVTADSSDFSLDPLLATRKIDGPTAADYLADIDELQRRLLDQSSYLTRLNFDYQRALSELRRSISEATQLARFVADVRKLVMQIGDCHASVQSGVSLPARGFLPLRAADSERGVAALKINLDQPLDANCPYLESIDGQPLERWRDAAAKYVARGSRQLVRRRSLERLGDIELLREELGVPPGEIVTIGLKSADGASHAVTRLRVTNQEYAVAQVRLQATRLLPGNIGYIRVPAMDDRLVETAAAQITAFRNTKGLIIDVRENGGGNYGMMRGIYGFFVPDDASPHVTNIAAYRLSSQFTRDHIEYRPTYRADWAGWNDQERASIRQAAAAFQPEWLPPQGKFSEWHYMILSRERSGRRTAASAREPGSAARDYFFYNKPVVVLSNPGSFSATDGFLNAFAALPQVTIMGEPSAGGSGATRQFQLPKTRVIVAMSSMASFRPNGKLFDGNGIEVDVAVEPTLEDFTSDADTVLARGIGVINEKAK
jgi:hypothetical protein